MKIGYIVLCHKSPYIVSKIVSKLIKDNESAVFIHVDKKTDIKPYVDAVGEAKNVTFILFRSVFGITGGDCPKTKMMNVHRN